MKNNPEDYILAVWEIEESFGKVNEKDVASRLKVSLPTAWESLHRLADDNIITIGRNGLSFTEKGRGIARNAMRAHRITEYFAFTVLEVPWEESHEAVMYLEHGFSGKMLENLYKNMGYPEKCPHGNPINVTAKIDELNLVNVSGGQYKVGRVVYEDKDFLKALANNGAKTGNNIHVQSENDTFIITGENGEMKVDKKTAAGIRVTNR